MKNILQFTLICICLISVIYCNSKYKVINTTSNSTTVTLHLNYTGPNDYYVKENNHIIKQAVFTLQMHTFS